MAIGITGRHFDPGQSPEVAFGPLPQQSDTSIYQNEKRAIMTTPGSFFPSSYRLFSLFCFLHSSLSFFPASTLCLSIQSHCDLNHPLPTLPPLFFIVFLSLSLSHSFTTHTKHTTTMAGGSKLSPFGHAIAGTGGAMFALTCTYPLDM